jgi:hypothetical protein
VFLLLLVRFIIGPNIGGALGAANAAVAALGAMLASFLLIAIAVPESYPPKPAAAARGELGWCQSFTEAS